jgi:hypothetical protein
MLLATAIPPLRQSLSSKDRGLTLGEDGTS